MQSNIATLDEKSGFVTSRRADRHFEEEGFIFCAALDKLKLPSFPEYEVRLRYATEHRCGVVVKGPKLSGNISGTDPLKDNRLLLKAEPLPAQLIYELGDKSFAGTSQTLYQMPNQFKGRMLF